MTTDDFRRLALSLPETNERAHMGHPDFRVCGKIFATLLYPDKHWGMVKLTPDQQKEFVQADNVAFVPVKGVWGRRGCTNVLLRAAKAPILRGAITAAWRNAAPKRVAAQPE